MPPAKASFSQTYLALGSTLFRHRSDTHWVGLRRLQGRETMVTNWWLGEGRKRDCPFLVASVV